MNHRVLLSSKGARRTKSVSHVRSIATSEIRAELERILSSGIFATADRMKRFLRFVVKETLDGRGDKLNELQLGAEVYDRSEKFDPRVDSIVRVDAGRLRSKLREFYVSEGGTVRSGLIFQKVAINHRSRNLGIWMLRVRRSGSRRNKPR